MNNFNIELLKVDPKDKVEKLYNIGVELSPLLYFFVYGIIDYAIKNNINTIYYQTREGETFIKVHDIIKENNVFEGKIPNNEILEVSRIATFAPSLKEFSIAELMRLWSQYSRQSVDDLFKTLNIDINNYVDYIEKFDIDSSKKIEKMWMDENIKNLFEDKSFVEKMNKEIKQKKIELLNFFERKGIYQDDKPMFVVDLGWRGSIQDNLAYIFDKKDICGFYYTLFDFYNDQPRNTTKEAFIKDKNVIEKYIKPMVVLFEMIFNPESGSVVGYKDGHAIRSIKQSEFDIVKNLTSHIQKGMIDGSRKLNEYTKNHKITNKEINTTICDLIKKLKENPPKDLAETYYNLVHNDTFGTGEYIDKNIKLSKLDKINIIKCRNILRKEDWKEAFFVYNNIHLLKYILKIKSKIKKFL